MVLTAIFCFAYLKVDDMKDRLLTDTFEFTTPKLVEKQAGKNVHTNVEQSSMFHISAQFARKVVVAHGL